VEGNSELAAMAESPGAEREGGKNLGCDGQTVNEWMYWNTQSHHDEPQPNTKHTA